MLDNAWGSSGIIEGALKNTDTLVIEPNGTAVILRRDYDVMDDMIFGGVQIREISAISSAVRWAATSTIALKIHIYHFGDENVPCNDFGR